MLLRKPSDETVEVVVSAMMKKLFNLTLSDVTGAAANFQQPGRWSRNERGGLRGVARLVDHERLEADAAEQRRPAPHVGGAHHVGAPQRR